MFWNLILRQRYRLKTYWQKASKDDGIVKDRDCWWLDFDIKGRSTKVVLNFSKLHKWKWPLSKGQSAWGLHLILKQRCRYYVDLLSSQTESIFPKNHCCTDFTPRLNLLFHYTTLYHSEDYWTEFSEGETGLFSRRQGCWWLGICWWSSLHWGQMYKGGDWLLKSYKWKVFSLTFHLTKRSPSFHCVVFTEIC